MTCPICRQVMTASTTLTDDKSPPKVGDVTICVGCESVLRFGDANAGALKLQALDRAEIAELDEQTKTELAIARAAVQRLKLKGAMS
jgi:hypothetical protein